MTAAAAAGSRRALLVAAARAFAAAGIASPRVEAELLLAHALGVERSRLAVAAAVSPSVGQRFADTVARRLRHEPLQHIVGTAPFRYRQLAVGPGVFIPRPETELLVELVASRLRPGAVVVDLCAGSGAIALAVAQEFPGTEVWAVENSPAALRWLRANATGTDVEVVAADVRTLQLSVTADVVLANPPYLPEATPVPPEVLADPPEALFAGPDGLALIPAVAAAAYGLLRPGGVFAMEHDPAQADAVRSLVGAAGFGDVGTAADLTGRPRFVTGRRA